MYQSGALCNDRRSVECCPDGIERAHRQIASDAPEWDYFQFADESVVRNFAVFCTHDSYTDMPLEAPRFTSNMVISSSLNSGLQAILDLSLLVPRSRRTHHASDFRDPPESSRSNHR
jgi:hypothetical protein